MIRSLKVDSTKRIPVGERHSILVSIADSLLLANLGRKTEQELRDFFSNINSICCDPEPLPEPEISNIWNSGMAFVQEVRNEKKSIKTKQVEQEEKKSIIEEACEVILNNFRFVTIEELKVILYYRDGVYVKGGEVLIEKEAEAIFGYQLSNQLIAEIKGHLMRMTYHSHTEFDKHKWAHKYEKWTLQLCDRGVQAT